jgi:hypothetical protein
MNKKLPCIPLQVDSLSLSLSLSLLFCPYSRRRCWQIFLKQKSWWFCHVLNLHFSSLASAQPSKRKRIGRWEEGINGIILFITYLISEVLRDGRFFLGFCIGLWSCGSHAITSSPCGSPVSPLLLSLPPLSSLTVLSKAKDSLTRNERD